MNLEYYLDQERALAEKLAKIEGVRSERRKASGMNYYVPNAVQDRAHKSVARTILLCGANRIGKCVTYKTLIDTADGEILVGELYRRGKPFKVYAWDGKKKVIANASAPFKKGRHKSYRIEMLDGRWIEAADRHRILMRNGHWAYVAELYHAFSQKCSCALKSLESKRDFSRQSEFFASHHQTTSDTFHSTHVSSAPSCVQTGQDYQDGYSEDCHLHGELLHASLSSARSFSPLQDDVQQLYQNLSYLDDLGNRYNDSHQLDEYHLSTQDDHFQNVGLYAESGFYNDDTTYLLSDVELRKFFQPVHVSASGLRLDNEVFLDPFKSPLLLDANQIISYNSIGFQDVYDFEVEEYHNYFAGGLINHNSYFGAMELSWHLTKQYPDWFPKERRFNGPIRAAISVDSFDKVANVIEPKLKSLLPTDFYRIRRKAGYLHRIECRDGSTVVVLTLEMDDSAYESADWDFIWEDEPQDQRKREGLIRGLVDRRGLEVITFTPLTEPWMKEELIDKADGKRIECFFAQMRDNKFDIQGRPILSEEAIQEFEASLPEEIREIRVEGQFFTLRGRVYKEFSDAHIKEFKYQYPDPVICVLDPHDRKPHHVIWAFVDRNDDVFVDYELIVRCELDDLAKRIRSVEQMRGYKMRKRLIDPNFGLRPAKPGVTWSVKDELARNDTGFYPANDDVELRHYIVRDLLHYDIKKELSATNCPKLFFNRLNCPATIRSMRNLQFDEWVAATRMKRDPKEVEQEKDSDGADCVGYLCVSRPKFKNVQAISEENYALEGAAY